MQLIGLGRLKVSSFFKFKLWLVLLIIGLTAFSSNVSLTSNKPNGIQKMKNKNSNKDFSKVEADSNDIYDCSPRFEKTDEMGIIINAPEAIYLNEQNRGPFSSGFADIIVCGACKFKYDTLGLNGDFIREILFVAVDTKTNENYSGKVTPVFAGLPGGSPFDGNQKMNDEYKDHVITQYFNPNLARILALPEREAEYIIYATLGEYKSNVIKITIKK